MPAIIPNLWFDDQAEQAAGFYVSIFPNSRILEVTNYPEVGPGPAGAVMSVSFEIDGQPFIAINGGPEFHFTEAVSLEIPCDTQEEVDRYWNALIADGGQESQCGWLKDKYGLSWQVVPTGMSDLFRGPDPQKVNRAMKAMLGMRKIDIAELRRAAEDESDSA
ncbi:VOC family protein [Skermania sp. ID1734]|uniref:VOC family protein n=1 Tax=Skermania sp. ID1734 TaxID=2597516 RepID=UPI00117C2475|nr:VOC family protein [Skermania sp. ID1734]TSD96632.1 VOC family protein [Skermania sp. ID1734]